ncbi:MAG TPA: hypothetical protein VK728_02700 [Candidatus Sulfotelmatobacter sp.]|jgi:hypothetical protein|nr:hypothetical protein [Candidatus Sulfotelmatobacter sp.]
MFVAIIGAVWLLCFLGIPILALFSIREWATTYRATLPRIRSGIGLLSVGVIFFGWLYLVTLAVFGIFNAVWLDFFTQKRNLHFLALAVGASVTSLTLKGNARLQALAAGALLVLFAMLWLSREMP